MHWSSTTISALKKLHNNNDYAEWSDAIKNGEIDQFSESLESLLRRLSGILISELEISPHEKDRILRVLELASVGGKTL